MEDIMKEGRTEAIREEDRVYKRHQRNRVNKENRPGDGERGSNERK